MPDDNRATLKIGVDSAHAGDTLKGTVRVHVRRPSPASLEIPVFCTTREGERGAHAAC